MTADDEVWRWRGTADPKTRRSVFVRLDVLVYVYRDADGAPLYVGQSYNLYARKHHHAARSPWFSESTGEPEVLSAHRSKRAALDEEAATIRRLRPKYNIVHNRGVAA